MKFVKLLSYDLPRPSNQLKYNLYKLLDVQLRNTYIQIELNIAYELYKSLKIIKTSKH